MKQQHKRSFCAAAAMVLCLCMALGVMGMGFAKWQTTLTASGSVSAGASISASSVPAVSAGAASGYAASLLASGTSGCTASVFVSAPQPLSSRAKQNSMAQKYRYFIPRSSLHRCAHPGAAMAAHTQRPRRTDRRGPPHEAPARNSLCLPAFARR